MVEWVVVGCVGRRKMVDVHREGVGLSSRGGGQTQQRGGGSVASSHSKSYTPLFVTHQMFDLHWKQRCAESDSGKLLSVIC